MSRLLSICLLSTTLLAGTSVTDSNDAVIPSHLPASSSLTPTPSASISTPQPPPPSVGTPLTGPSPTEGSQTPTTSHASTTTMHKDHGTANPTISNSGSGALVIILSLLGVCVVVAACYVIFQRFVLGRRPHAEDWSLKSHFEYPEAYEPIEREYETRDNINYPVAYPPMQRSNVSLTEPTISSHHQSSSDDKSRLQQHHGLAGPRYTVDAESEFY